MTKQMKRTVLILSPKQSLYRTTKYTVINFERTI